MWTLLFFAVTASVEMSSQCWYRDNKLSTNADLRGKCNIYIAHKVKCSKSQLRQILTCFEHA